MSSAYVQDKQQATAPAPAPAPASCNAAGGSRSSRRLPTSACGRPAAHRASAQYWLGVGLRARCLNMPTLPIRDGGAWRRFTAGVWGVGRACLRTAPLSRPQQLTRALPARVAADDGHNHGSALVVGDQCFIAPARPTARAALSAAAAVATVSVRHNAPCCAFSADLATPLQHEPATWLSGRGLRH